MLLVLFYSESINSCTVMTLLEIIGLGKILELVIK